MPGPLYEWPELEHGIYVDARDNVWLGGGGESDAQVLKFSRQGEFLMQIGRQGENGGSNEMANLPRDLARELLGVAGQKAC